MSVLAQTTKTKSRARVSILLLCAPIWFALCFLVSGRYLVSTVVLTGDSMLPTLKSGEPHVIHRWLPRLAGYRRGDLVMFRDPEDEGFTIKRLIALPGDRLQFKQGRVYLNGKLLAEPYLPENSFTLNPRREAEQIIELGPHDYFLLGDNRDNSQDSRYFGPVPGQRLIGKLMAR